MEGNLYGTSAGNECSLAGCGSVFELTPPTGSGGNWTETTLHSFTGLADGASPLAGLLLRDGILYGDTYMGGNSDSFTGGGVIFEIKP
jgi:hypothetical protein